MAHRFQEITEVYRQELAALARGDKWTAFLRSACRNYKLHFEEQVLVHAQRPDATAVLEMAHWNRRFDRWVDPGSTGIAVFDRDTPGRARLKYYFDISDTHEGRFHRPVPLWQVSAEQEPEIVEVLEHRFGALAQKEMLCSLVLGRNRHNIYQAVAGTEMLEIFDLRFFSLTDYINDGPTFATACFIWVVFFPHSCHKPSPPINGIAPKRPCKYPLRMFSPFLGEKDASEYSSVAQDRSSFSANQI